MKYSWLSISVIAAILSGCSNMMYGNGVAPVSNGNTYYGQPQYNNYPPVNQTPRPPMRPVVQPRQQSYPQPVQPNVNRAAMVQPSARQPNIQDSAASPYTAQPAAPAKEPAKTANADDGWSVKAGSQPPTATDTPKIESPTVNNEAAIQQPVETPKKETSPVIRPKQRGDEAPSAQQPAETPRSEQTQTPAAQQPAERQVASNVNAGKAAAGSAAVSSLLKKANGELGKGNLEGAAAYLQDAQRIDSKNPKILYDIANIRYHQGRYREAEATAARAVNLGGGAAMQKKSWTLIANSRKQLGDNQGAIQAANKASSF